MALLFRRRIFVILVAMTAVPATLTVAGWVLSVSALAPTAGARASLEQIGASTRDMLRGIDTTRLSPGGRAAVRHHLAQVSASLSLAAAPRRSSSTTRRGSPSSW